MGSSFYFFHFYLLVQFLVPLLLRCRWGLVAALIATVVELVLVVPVFFLMDACGVFSDVLPRKPPPVHPFEMRAQATLAGAMILVLGIYAAGAALLGGGLAVLRSVALAVWRSIAKRRRNATVGGRLG